MQFKYSTSVSNRNGPVLVIEFFYIEGVKYFDNIDIYPARTNEDDLRYNEDDDAPKGHLLNKGT